LNKEENKSYKDKKKILFTCKIKLKTKINDKNKLECSMKKKELL